MNCEVDNIKAMMYKQLFAILDELKFFSMEGKSTEKETHGKNTPSIQHCVMKLASKLFAEGQCLIYYLPRESSDLIYRSCKAIEAIEAIWHCKSMAGQ